MSRRSLATALAALAVGVAFLAFCVRMLAVRSEPDAGAGTRRASASEERSAPLAREGAGEPERDVVDASAAIEHDAREAPTTRAAVRGSVLSGRVVLPAGTPADEEIAVLVALDDGSEPFTLSPDSAGCFELALPPGGVGGELGIVARYAFLEQRVAFDAGTREARLEPELGACFEGRVRVPPGWEDVLASAEIEVELQWPVGTESRAKTNCEQPALRSDGSFVAGGVPCGWSQRIRARSSLARASSSPTVVPKPGETHHVEWEWRVGAQVSGRVVTDTGAPIARASLGTGGGPFECTTGADGAFSLAALSTPECWVQVYAPGYVPRLLEVSELREAERRTDVTIELDQGVELVCIVRLADGTPVPEAEIELGPSALARRFAQVGAPPPTAVRRADGEFVLRGLPALAGEVLARAPPPGGSRADPAWTARRQVDLARERRIELVLGPDRRSIVGRVVDARGEPVSGALVIARSLEASLDASGASVFAKTRAPDGEFELRLGRVGRWLVDAIYDTCSAEAVEVDSSRENRPLELRLRAESRVRGRVLDPDGRAVRRARIEGASSHGWSDADGRFDATVPAGKVELYASAEPFARSEHVALALDPGEVEEGLELHLRRGGEVVGRVVDPRWLDLAQPIVSGWTLSEGGPSGSCEVALDRDGAFHFRALDPGPWAFVVRSRGGVERPPEGVPAFRPSARVEVLDGELRRVELGAPAAGVRVRGRVSRAGNALTDAEVGVFSQDPASDDYVELATDAAGRFEVALPQPGEYTFAVQRPGGDGEALRTVQVPACAEFELALELGRGVIAGVLIPAEGVAVAGAVVELVHVDSGAAARCVAEPSGRFRLEGLDAGVHRLFVGHVMHNSVDAVATDSQPGRVARDGLRVRDGEVLELAIPVGPPVTVFGTVWSRSHPEYRRVLVQGADGVALLPGPVDLDWSGRFRIDGLPFGRLRLEVRDGAGRTLDSLELDVASTPYGPVEIALD